MHIGKIVKGFLFVFCIFFIIAGPFAFEAYKEYIDTPAKEEEAWKGIIVIWDYPSFNKEDGTRYSFIADKIKQFEKENKGVFINFKPLDMSTAIVQIQTAAETNTLPDIAPVGAERAIQEMDILEPLNPFVEMNSMDRYIEEVKGTVIYNDIIYGIPRLVDLNVIALNKRALNSQEEVVINTGQELIYIVTQLCEKTGLPFKIKDTSLLMAAKCFEKYPEFEHLIRKKLIKETSGIYSDFENRNYSAIACSTMDLARIEYVFGSGGEYQPFPLIAENDQKLIGTCRAYGVMKQEDKGKTEMCIKFINFLTNNEEQLKLAEFNAFPTMKGIHGIYKEGGDFKMLEELYMKKDKILINNLSADEITDLMRLYEVRTKN